MRAWDRVVSIGRRHSELDADLPRRLPRRKQCQRYEKVAAICDRVLMGEVEHTEVGLRTLAEEYLDLHLEFKALLTHLEVE